MSSFTYRHPSYNNSTKFFHFTLKRQHRVTFGYNVIKKYHKFAFEEIVIKFDAIH